MNKCFFRYFVNQLFVVVVVCQLKFENYDDVELSIEKISEFKSKYFDVGYLAVKIPKLKKALIVHEKFTLSNINAFCQHLNYDSFYSFSTYSNRKKYGKCISPIFSKSDPSSVK